MIGSVAAQDHQRRDQVGDFLASRPVDNTSQNLHQMMELQRRQAAEQQQQNQQEIQRPDDGVFEEVGDESEDDRVERDGGGHHGHHGHHAPIHHAPVHHAPIHHAPVHHAPVHHAPAYHAPAPYVPPVHHAPAPYKAPVHKAPVYKEEPRPYQFQYGVNDQYSGSQFQQTEAQVL